MLTENIWDSETEEELVIDGPQGSFGSVHLEVQLVWAQWCILLLLVGVLLIMVLWMSMLSVIGS